MSDFTDAIVEATGERVIIPRHWMDNPLLSRGYRSFTPPEPVVNPAPPVPEIEDEPEPEAPEPAQPPALSAHKDDWIAFAVHSGDDFEVASAMTKAELVEKYASA
jgi:hypothetical protein